MKYYRGGTAKTLKMEWDPFVIQGRNVYYANQIIGKEWGAHRWESHRWGVGALRVIGEYYSGGGCCGWEPSNGGILQYRAYGCLPMTYDQLMKGHLIVPGARWSTVKNALKIPPGMGGYIAIVPFFIPSLNDRNKRKLRPTYGPMAGGYPTRIVIAPSCTPNIWGNTPNCSDGIQNPEEHYGIDHVRKACYGNSILW